MRTSGQLGCCAQAAASVPSLTTTVSFNMIINTKISISINIYINLVQPIHRFSDLFVAVAAAAAPAGLVTGRPVPVASRANARLRPPRSATVRRSCCRHGTHAGSFLFVVVVVVICVNVVACECHLNRPCYCVSRVVCRCTQAHCITSSTRRASMITRSACASSLVLTVPSLHTCGEYYLCIPVCAYVCEQCR